MEVSTCALWGAMFNLPGRLDELLRRHGSMLPKGAEEEIPLIKRDLEKIISIIHDHNHNHNDEEMEGHASGAIMVRRCWTKEVRELGYDIEDCIDQYEHDAAGCSSSRSIPHPRRKITRRRRRTIKMPPRLPDKLKQRLWMANMIGEFSLRVQEALQRHGTYNLGGSSSSTNDDASSDHRLSVGEYAHDRRHFGIHSSTAMDKLREWLDVDNGGEDKLKVVFLVGAGGVGKTTVAGELYGELRRRFECGAFVRTSQKPNITRLLISMLSQVRPHQSPKNWKVHTLISSIRTHLQDKRYLIIIDDLWATSTWDIIKCALPDGNNCSRILTTTEIEDLAFQSYDYDYKYVLKMKPLGEDDSRDLFFSTVFGPNSTCPTNLREVSCDIIRKCGGLPLAIVTIASLLAKLRKWEQWGYVNKDLCYSLMTNPTMEGIKQVMNLSYNNLPQHLKPCMLYLSIYQEDYIIWKDDLVNQWMAEGLTCGTQGHDNEEISGTYFEELVGRKMVQPVHINENGKVLSCVIHPMVLNFIKYKSIEENFITAIDHSQINTVIADKVRRLSIHFGNTKDASIPTNMRLSQVRTLAIFGFFKCMPFIVDFRLLKVLILHFWDDEDSTSFDLTKISELFRLRYLKIISNVTLKLQKQIQGLQHLETLQIDARVSAVPSDITHLTGLLHLNLPADTVLPDGIGQMTSLRTLSFYLNGNSIENVISLGELTNIRDLQFTCSSIQPDNLKKKMQCLGSIIERLRNLKSITLLPTRSSYANSLEDAGATSMRIPVDGLSSVSSPPAHLERLELLPRICILSYFPMWIGNLSKLCILKIGVRELVKNAIDVLGGLPALIVLSLYVHTKPEEIIVFDKTGFPVLKYLKFNCCVPWLRFKEDSVHNLRKLKLGYNAHRADEESTIPDGMEYLSLHLNEVSVKIGVADPEKYDKLSAELEYKLAFGFDMIHPTVTIRCVKHIFDCKVSKSRLAQEDYGKVEQPEILEEDTDVPDEVDEIKQDYGQEASKRADSK
uniref:NB-ARC domain-containing protein n=1 Tax=Oryza glumipatula TaxID=40148 RepID=A0A0E0BM90_9ORYZ